MHERSRAIFEGKVPTETHVCLASVTPQCEVGHGLTHEHGYSVSLCDTFGHLLHASMAEGISGPTALGEREKQCESE